MGRVQIRPRPRDGLVFSLLFCDKSCLGNQEFKAILFDVPPATSRDASPVSSARSSRAVAGSQDGNRGRSAVFGDSVTRAPNSKWVDAGGIKEEPSARPSAVSRSFGGN